MFVKCERLGVCLEADGQEPTGTNDRQRGIYDEEENSAREVA